jgi:hypothetical protein
MTKQGLLRRSLVTDIGYNTHITRGKWVGRSCRDLHSTPRLESGMADQDRKASIR